MRRLSRTRLFLLEMLVNLFIFSIGAAICMLTLSNAYSLSAESRVQTEAQRVTQNAAMAFRAANGDLAALPNLLSGRWEDDVFTAWYSQDWRPVQQSDGIYCLKIAVKRQENHVLTSKIVVYSPKNEPVVELKTAQYIGTARKESST